MSPKTSENHQRELKVKIGVISYNSEVGHEKSDRKGSGAEYTREDPVHCPVLTLTLCRVVYNVCNAPP